MLVARWRLLGHVLRMHVDSPARKSMQHYFAQSNEKKFRGRERITLPVTISRDLARANNHKHIELKFQIKSFQNNRELQKLTAIAGDRELWKALCKEVQEAAQAERSQGLEARVQ